MSKHNPLYRVAEHLGYSEGDIAKIAAALGGGYHKVNASSGTANSGQMTALAASAGWSEQQKQTYCMVRGMVKQISAHRFSIDDPSKIIDVQELERHIRSGSVEQRISCKSALASLNLIP